MKNCHNSRVLCIEWPKRVLVFVYLYHTVIIILLTKTFVQMRTNSTKNIRYFPTKTGGEFFILKWRKSLSPKWYLGVQKTQVCVCLCVMCLWNGGSGGWEGCYLFTFSNIPVLITIIQWFLLAVFAFQEEWHSRHFQSVWYFWSSKFWRWMVGR